MEMKKLSNLVIDFFRNDIVWLVFYLAFAATVVERSITWLFFFEPTGGMTLRVVLGLWSTGLILGILFSVWLWLAIAANTFRTVKGKLMICLLMLGLLCNWVLLYAVAYAYLGLIDGERLVREPITCLYFSIVTWTTLGYGRCSPFNGCAICCGIGSIAWIYLDGLFYRDVRRVVQAADRKDFPVLNPRWLGPYR